MSSFGMIRCTFLFKSSFWLPGVSANWKAFLLIARPSIGLPCLSYECQTFLFISKASFRILGFSECLARLIFDWHVFLLTHTWHTRAQEQEGQREEQRAQGSRGGQTKWIHTRSADHIWFGKLAKMCWLSLLWEIDEDNKSIFQLIHLFFSSSYCSLLFNQPTIFLEKPNNYCI